MARLAKWSTELSDTIFNGGCLKCGNRNFEFIEGVGPRINPGLRFLAFLWTYDTAEPKWSASEVPRGLSGGCQCGRLMVVFVLLGSLFLFVPFDPGQ